MSSGLLSGILLSAALLLGRPPGTLAAEPAAVAQPATASQHPGRLKAQTYCATCHLAPEPSLLTRNIWKDIILQKMAFYSGILQLDMAKNEEADLYKASGLFPSAPLLPREDWKLIEDYYLSQSPAEKLPHTPRPEIALGLPCFTVDAPRFRRNPPLTTLVAVDPHQRVIYAADAQDQALHILDGNGRHLETIELGNIPVWLKPSPQGVYVACIGHFFPKEERRGQLLLLEQREGRWKPRTLMSNLPRPCHLEFADLNQDGTPDALVSMFGYLTGRFSWIERLDQDTRREHILFGKAGPLVSLPHDFDRDGWTDIAMLTGQESESLLLYLNDRQGGFRPPLRVFQKPPSYGHTYFEMADFNRDGLQDFVVCNGDNGDYESPSKPYHGVRIYLAQTATNYTETCFLPMHGAFRALARDYDEDGDLDLAVVGFYPDYENNPRESFVYFENQGDLRFKPLTFRECIAGRWMVLDAGDLDGDRDVDLVLGSLIRMPSQVPQFVRDTWEQSSPSILILRNTTRTPSPPPPSVPAPAPQPSPSPRN